MRIKLVSLLPLLAVAVVLSACTRERPAPDTTPTVAAQAAAATTGTPEQAEPVVERTDATPAATVEPTGQATAATTATPEPAAREVFQYTVKQGDTISSIAGRFNVDVQVIRELNFLPDDNIFAGQILTLPYIEGMTAEGAPTATPEPFQHVVAEGETLFSIAADYDINYLTLIEINEIENPDNLIVGTKLLIPGYTAPASQSTGGSLSSAPDTTAGGNEPVYHIVQPGESLNSIAVQYGVDAGELAAANNLANRNLIRVGQSLLIPGLTQRQAIEARGIRHTVQPGESLSQIAQRYGAAVEAIMALNGIDDPNTIYVGQELLIPQE
ncbi:MAG: LysM peptidoglycan-binding domain-containing protein [Caldilineaceae bacterium]|nr:LysM peptidoglycan-binding domain-containing protein [Caldilineaceae bacterium]